MAYIVKCFNIYWSFAQRVSECGIDSSILSFFCISETFKAAETKIYSKCQSVSSAEEFYICVPKMFENLIQYMLKKTLEDLY
jgi:hypothetical protein